MTHEELLAKIDWIGRTKDAESGTATALGIATLASLNALRAVVELHRPIKDTRENWYECEECRAVTDCSECYGVEFVEAPYPCPTIQAIEKALND